MKKNGLWVIAFVIVALMVLTSVNPASLYRTEEIDDTTYHIGDLPLENPDVGDLWYDTTLDEMNIWSGYIWQPLVPTVSGADYKNHVAKHYWGGVDPISFQELSPEIRVASEFATSGSGTSSNPYLSAIQLAIDDSPDIGGMVFVPAGHYEESAIELRGTSESKTKIAIMGAGVGNTVVKCPDSTNENVFEIGYNNGGKSGGGSDFYIGHLEVDGNKGNNTKQSANYPNGDCAEYRQNGIWTYDAYRVLIENVYVYDTCFNNFGNHGSNVVHKGEDITISNCKSSGALWHGFEFWNYIKNSTIINCISDGDTTDSFVIELHSSYNSIIGCKAFNCVDRCGIFILEDSHYNTIVSCIAKDCYLSGISITTNDCSNNAISNCVCERNGQNGMTITASIHNTISNCVTEGNTGEGITLTSGADYNIIDSCISKDNTAAGIKISLNACVYNVISNCIVSGCVHGIRLEGGFTGDQSYNKITGNIIEDCGSGLYMRYDISYNTFSDNLIKKGSNGIALYGDVTNCTFSDNYIDEFTNGIYSNGATNDYNYYTANRLIGVTTPFTIAGTHTIVEYNEGYITEKSSSSTITNGNTHITVTHEMDVIPTSITVTGNHSEVSACWVVNITSTQFEIWVSSAVSYDRVVYWYAEAR
jgi:parallel beta-helix repeat protein